MLSKRSGRRRTLPAVLLVAVLLLGLVALTVLAQGDRDQLAPSHLVSAAAQENLAAAESGRFRTLAPAPTVQSLDPDALALVAAYEQVLGGIYDSVLPSVVHIQVTQQDNGPSSMPDLPFDHPQLPDLPFQQGEGSGFVWDRAGHIVTNYHVVEEADAVTVVFADGTMVSGEVLGGDPNVDLAVVQIDVDSDQLAPVRLGDSEDLRVGQIAVAIGNPFGLENTMTYGIISALGRTISSGTSQYSIPEVIQTDAPINPGNSGGPLLDREGRVIGINTQIVSRSGSSAGIGFAVPVNIAKRVVPALVEDGSYEYAWLGISGQSVTSGVAQLMQLPPETRGALILGTVEDGPAAEAGLRGSQQVRQLDGLDYRVGGDIIVDINDTPVEGMDDLITYLTEQAQPGDMVKLRVIRGNGQPQEIEVTLGKRPEALR